MMFDDSRSLAVWGTGNICSQLLKTFRDMEPVLYIDNDRGKVGCSYANAYIVSPMNVENWKELYIILALDNYIPVKFQIEEMGLREGIDFIWYRDWIFQNKEISVVLREAEQFREACRHESRYQYKRLLFSDFLSFDKGVCDFVNKMNKKEGDIVLLSEAGWVDERGKELTFPVIRLPELYWHNMYFRKGWEIPCFQEQMEQIKGKEYLQEAAANLRASCPDMAEGYEYFICNQGEKLIRELLRCWKPKEIILWNAFYAFHFLIRKVCKEENVPVRYMEFGHIPGTIMVEDVGQMGESWPARKPKEFMQIQIDTGDYERTVRRLEALKKSGLNRNLQPHNNMLEEVIGKLKKDSPVVFYAGQNDFASGMQPYTENSRKFHSPIFKTSDEGALYLAELCGRKGWNIIYKPHPMMRDHSRHRFLPPNVIVVNDVNINELIDISDVVVTILSTVSYIALIRDKPVVMMGYTQLKEKGCTYEAFAEKAVEGEIESALCMGYTEEKKRNFIYHIVQISKFYGC